MSLSIVCLYWAWDHQCYTMFMLLCPTHCVLECENERNKKKKLHSVQYFMIIITEWCFFFAPQIPPALASTQLGASLLLTWLKTLKDLHLELKVCFCIYIFFTKVAVWFIFPIILSVFLFINEDSNFKWANAGATVFGSAVTSTTRNNGDEEGSDEEEAPNNVDIHFEPIVSLPEVC